MLEDGERGPVGIVYDATSARSNPALAGFISSPEGFEEEVLLTCQFRKHFSFFFFCGGGGVPFLSDGGCFLVFFIIACS